MDKLFPIIRRKRRPLIAADAPPVAAVTGQPVAPKPLVESVVLADGHHADGQLAAPEQPGKLNDGTTQN
jgi:hypothetical protein